MKYDANTIKNEIEASLFKKQADVFLYNLKTVDVYTNEIRSSSISIYNGKIIGIGSKDVDAKVKIDCQGQYAMPGFIDTHMHIETTLLTPEALADVIIPHGTTTLFVDAMEIANVCGEYGLNELIKDTGNLPFRMFLEIPSRVPSAPGLETAGAELDVGAVSKLLKNEMTVSLGELDSSKILGLKLEYLQKIEKALESGRICNGHAIGLDAQQLNAYATAHLVDDHECVEIEELINRLRVGIRVLIREGSSERNTRHLLKGVLDRGLPTENLMFCTDDKHVNDIYNEGHINFNVGIAIDLGMNPVDAIKIATINAARHFKVDHILGSLTPGRFADIVFVEDIKKIKPAMVFKDGKKVAENGKVISQYSKQYPDELFDTVKLKDNFNVHDFEIYCDANQAKCKVIQLITDQIINKEIHEWMEISCDKKIMPDVKRDILKLSIVERHGKNGKVSNAFVKGFGFKKGALASSVSHDHHNIVVVGTDDRDMFLAVKHLEKIKGGFVAVADGVVVDSVALPLAGLMSSLSAKEVMDKMDLLNRVAKDMGCNLNSPFMTLSFISLPTVPELGLTDFGLIDVMKHRVTDLIIDKKN